jgi:hypothetical protein
MLLVPALGIARFLMQVHDVVLIESIQLAMARGATASMVDRTDMVDAGAMERARPVMPTRRRHAGRRETTRANGPLHGISSPTSQLVELPEGPGLVVDAIYFGIAS